MLTVRKKPPFAGQVKQSAKSMADQMSTGVEGSKIR
jgi:hypothetical protein